MVIEIKGDLLETPCDVIAHGVNCQNVMGSGVARVLFEKWPIVKEAYHQHFLEYDPGEDGINFLGTIQDFMVNGEYGFINCFTQQYFGPADKKYVSYDAIYDCFKQIADIYDEVAIPRIGCGLAGGNWEIVKRIINDAVGDKCKVYAYYLDGKKDDKVAAIES